MTVPARLAFNQQRQNAKHRGILFRLSFEEWWQIWESSGCWSKRGRSRGLYAMSRFKDRGAYEVGNVQIITNEQNSAEIVVPLESRANIGKSGWTDARRKAAAVRMCMIAKARWAIPGEKDKFVELTKRRWADDTYRTETGRKISSSLADFWSDSRSDDFRGRLRKITKGRRRRRGRLV